MLEGWCTHGHTTQTIQHVPFGNPLATPPENCYVVIVTAFRTQQKIRIEAGHQLHAGYMMHNIFNLLKIPSPHTYRSTKITHHPHTRSSTTSYQLRHRSTHTTYTTICASGSKT